MERQVQISLNRETRNKIKSIKGVQSYDEYLSKIISVTDATKNNATRNGDKN